MQFIFEGLFIPEQCLFKTNGSKTCCQLLLSVLTTSQDCFLFYVSYKNFSLAPQTGMKILL